MKENKIILLVFTVVLIWSGINPKDYFTWFLEVVPAIIGIVVLAFSYKKFKFSKLIYVLILIHAIILMIGGHYTYAEVPFFDWLKEVFELSRNNYDKVGHFAQGFIPAMIARELLVRKNVILVKSWLNFIIVSICMAISVAYEFIEWFVAEQTGESAEAFLGTQGYIWDTQADMLFATIGAIAALVVLSKVHDRSMEKRLDCLTQE
jgi:putative membrane protein